LIYLLNNQSYPDTQNLQVIQIKFLDKDLNFDVDYLLFTSKNGVFATDRLNKNWKNIPAICIGEPTANVVKNLGGKVVYVATKSYGDELAKEIIQNFKPSKILFLRAKKVLSNIVEILKQNNFDIKEEIVYQTECKQIQTIPKKGVFIFTSPSTVKCFLSQVEWKKEYKAVAIGTKTAKAFPYDIVISPIQTIPHCIKIAKELDESDD
jgi:uroporphyrinogen-III synthase